MALAPESGREDRDRRAARQGLGIVGNFGDLSWLPGVAKTEGTGGNTPDQAKRKLTSPMAA